MIVTRGPSRRSSFARNQYTLIENCCVSGWTLATKIESVLGSAYALSTSDVLALLHVSVVDLTASLCADQQLLRVRPYDLDQIRTKLPGISAERFKRCERKFCSLRSAFRVTDVNSPLQALELVPVGAGKYLKKLTSYVDITRSITLTTSQLRRIPQARY